MEKTITIERRWRVTGGRLFWFHLEWLDEEHVIIRDSDKPDFKPDISTQWWVDIAYAKTREEAMKDGMREAEDNLKGRREWLKQSESELESLKALLAKEGE